jgi:hypothetical protein
MWNGEEHTENPQGELTEEQYEWLENEITRTLAYGQVVRAYEIPSLVGDIMQAVSNALYYSKENR